MRHLLNERGFVLLHVIFLTLITALTAQILFNAAPRITTPHAALRLTALHLANEQLALMESKAASGDLEAGSYSFAGDTDDLTTENAGADKLVEFKVVTQVTADGNLRGVTVKVSWTVGREDFELETEKTFRIEQTT